MVKSAKEKQGVKRKAKKKENSPNVKAVTYSYPDGLSCTVVTPIETPVEAPPVTALGLALPSSKRTHNNNMKKNNATATSSTNSPAAPAVSSNTTAPKDYSDLRIGVKKKEAIDIVHNFKFPDRPFTIKEVLLATGINHWYVTSYIKSHAKVVGDAPKAPGVRGKVAKLYQLEAKA